MEPFITPEDLALFMDLETVDDLPASYVLGIDSSCQAIRKYIDQEISYVEDDEEYRDGTGRAKMRLRQRPIRDLSSVVIDDEEIDLEAIVIRNNVLTLVDGSVFTRGVANCVITYSHGWDIDDMTTSSDNEEEGFDPIPGDIKLVALSVARRYMQRWGATGLEGEIMMEQLGDYQYILHPDKRVHDHDLLRYEAAVLDRYRVGLVP